MSHKFTAIKQILDTYPQLNFVLVGDSGEQDPLIYREVVKHFPGVSLHLYTGCSCRKKQETAQQVVP
ncbi:MAG: App1 family protein [Chitinophagaceae bacterium]|nr:App1 family protein [Chitinophagaceae bacterium]